MPIDPVSSNTPSAQSQRGLSSLKSEDFFKILVTEMQHQDPFKPSDSSQMISNVSQIRTIEQSDQLTKTLGQLTQSQRMGGSNELIGKYVQAVATDDMGNETALQGVVTSVYYNSDGQAILELDTGDMVLSSDVVRVTTPEAIEAEAAAANNK
jgi:flagellar basal-body rod modification protein FlgD